MVRAWVYEELVDSAAARKDYEAARVLLEGAPAHDAKRARRHAILGIVYAGLGRTAAAIKEARLGMDFLPVSKDAFFAPLMMHHAAITYMRVGEPDASVEQLERLSTMPNYQRLSVHELRLDPLWDPQRNNPRFGRLVEGGGQG